MTNTLLLQNKGANGCLAYEETTKKTLTLRSHDVNVIKAKGIPQLANALPTIPSKDFPDTIIHGNLNASSIANNS